MATKPLIALPEFASNPASDAGTVEPTQAKKDIGWLVGEKPPRETFNWLHRSAYRWLAWCEASIDELSEVKVPAGYLTGFQMANNPTDLANHINFNQGVASATTSLKAIDNLGTGYSNKYLNVAWAEGKNQGGLGNGLTKTANTYYRCFVISKIDGTVDYGFDTSETAANLLTSAASYSYYRQIGWIVTDGNADIIGFNQSGDDFWLEIPSNTGIIYSRSVAQLQTVITPPDVSTQAHIIARATANGYNFNVHYLVSPTRSRDVTVNSYNANIQVYGHNETSIGSNTSLLIPSSSNSQIRVNSDNNTNNSYVYIISTGWRDTRGKE